MSNIYEVIDAIRLYRGYSMRELAYRADMPYTSLASLMKRRSNRISKDMLEALIKALEINWTDLVAFHPEFGEDTDEGRWFGATCSTDEVHQILENVIGSGFERFLAEAQNKDKQPGTWKNRRQPAVAIDPRVQFKQSMNLMFDRLNDEGLLEAMRRILDVANEPRYCFKKDEQ